MLLKVNKLYFIYRNIEKEEEFTVYMVAAPEPTVRPYMFEPESDPEWEESAKAVPQMRRIQQNVSQW